MMRVQRAASWVPSAALPLTSSSIDRCALSTPAAAAAHQRFTARPVVGLSGVGAHGFSFRRAAVGSALCTALEGHSVLLHSGANLSSSADRRQPMICRHDACCQRRFASSPTTTRESTGGATPSSTSTATRGHHHHEDKHHDHHHHGGSGEGWQHVLWQNVRRNWFTLALPFALAACYESPEWMCSGGRLGADKWKDATIVAMFFCSGLGLALSDLRVAMRCVRAHAMIQGISFVVCPIFFYFSVVPLLRLLDFPDTVCTGALFLACVPTTVGVSIALTRLAGGDVGVALINSALGNFAGVIITPFVAQIVIGASGSMDVVGIVSKLAMVMLLPSAAGMALRRVKGAALKPLADRGVFREAQSIALLTLLIHVFSNAFAKSDETQAVGGVEEKSKKPKRDVVSGAMLGQLIGVLFVAQTTLVAVSYGLARAVGLSGSISVAAALCGSQKTAAMGIPLMMLVYKDRPEELPMITMPILCYHPMQAVYGGLLASTILRRAAMRL